jgi:hypothetical protein
VEFYTTILPEVFIDLQADIGSDVNNDSLYKRAWTYTAGHWNLTTMLATVFDDDAGWSNFRTATVVIIEQSAF